MAHKQETSFSKLVNSKLDPSIYFEKTNNPFRYAMPDFYYEGPKDILWTEYKWIEKPWTKNLDPSQICLRKEWIHQRHWLERAYKNNKNAWAIIGIGAGRNTKGYILEYPFEFNIESHLLLAVDDIVKSIQECIS